ncbi:MAG: Na+/H+ antiporter [Candidatus Altiarchaeota archaeon]|nr:Na+/H+ antiporter [Candidatus Altiarchaeota archaeon]
MVEELVLTELQFIGLLLIAVLASIAVKYIRLPYTIALVLLGTLIGFIGFHPIPLSEELILFIFLPALLFEGAINIDFDKLRENLDLILLLAVIGLTLAILFVGYSLHHLTGIPLIYTLLFGAMIMPTDPVSVLALFKKLGVSRRLSVLVEGESLFNDGTGIVLFGVILSLVESQDQQLSILQTILDFFFVVLGGLVIGLVTGYAVYSILRHLDDHLIEVVLTGILAYGTFLICESLHVSGVIGVVAAGLLIGNRGTVFAMSPTTRIAIQDSWELTAFIVNSLIFLLIGIQIPMQEIYSHLELIIYSIAVVLLARALTVYSLTLLLNLRKKTGISYSWMHVINLGGIHGSIPIALLLSLPAISYLEELSFMVFGTVLFSLVVQGLTIEPLVKKLNLVETHPKIENYTRLITKKISAQQALNELASMRKNKEIPSTVYKKLKNEYSTLLEELAAEVGELIKEYPQLEFSQRDYSRKRMLLAQKSSIQESVRKGIIRSEAASHLLTEIDAELEEKTTH